MPFVPPPLYVPLTGAIYQAAYVGAMIGMGASGRDIAQAPDHDNPENYKSSAWHALKWAQAIDTTAGVIAAPSVLQVDAMRITSEGIWAGILPGPRNPAAPRDRHHHHDDEELEYPYLAKVKAAIAVMTEAQNVFVAAGGPPSPFPPGPPDPRQTIVTAQSNAAVALLANSSTPHYLLVTATSLAPIAGTYAIGDLLYDNGTGVGNVAIVPALPGQTVLPTVALSGGTVTFAADTAYVWNGTSWVLVRGSAVGGTPFAQFFGISGTAGAPDYLDAIAATSPVNFPEAGPTSGVITASSATDFVLPAIGTYEISWQVPVTEAAQLVLRTSTLSAAFAVLPDTLVGNATGHCQIVGSAVITTTGINTVLEVYNPSATAIHVTPNAGGASPVSASLLIKQLA